MEALVSPGKLGLRDQTVVYGMTETSPVTFGCGTFDALGWRETKIGNSLTEDFRLCPHPSLYADVDAPIVRRCETVGRVYPHVHAKIVSPDDSLGQPLPVGQPGELCVSFSLINHEGRCK